MRKAILHDGTVNGKPCDFNVAVVDTCIDPDDNKKYAEVKPLDFKSFNRWVLFEKLEFVE